MGSMPQISIPVTDNLKIPIVEPKYMNFIVSTLDKFEHLCNDISAGLPGEISLRQKQYEYYRDRLLTFEEVHS